MRGYSFYSLLFFLMLGLKPSTTEDVQRVQFAMTTISADRTSPAFSAIEDAFTMEDLIDKTKPKNKKIELKGLKVSSVDKKPKIAVKKINLGGEVVGVEHFTNKFILKKKKIRLAENLAEAINPRVVGQPLSSASPAKIQKIELPNGITLTKVIPAENVNKQNTSIQPLGGVFSNSIKATAYTQNLISGTIDLQGEVVGDQLTYYINRNLDGKVMETGVIDATVTDKFKMEVGGLLGLIQVELRTEQGEVLAYGEYPLSPTAKGLNNINLEIFPSESSVAGRVLASAASLKGKEVPLEQSQKSISGILGVLNVGDDGFFDEEVFERGSSFIVKTEAKDYWSDLNFGLSGKPLYPRLINKEDFKEFAKTLDPFGEEVEVTSALVGSVSQNGFAQQDLKIKIFNYEYEKPVYFGANGSADPKLETTSTNGGFIFTNLADGGYLVQAYRNDILIAQKWYFVKEKHISQGQINITSKPLMVVSAETFPRIKGEQGFVLNEIGALKNQIIKSTSEEILTTITTPELMALSIEKSQTHSRHIYLAQTKSKKKRFKVSSQDWLEAFLNSRRSNANRAKPMVIGFFNTGFKLVKETTDVLTKNSQVFYFDKFGGYSDVGLPGGGFIITEARLGVGSVVISAKGSDVFLNKLVLTQPYSVSVF